MESVTEKMKLTNTSVLLVVFLTTITFGLYYPIWFLKRREEINKLNSDENLGKGVFVFVLVLFAITLLLSFYSGFSDGATQANNGQEMQIEFNPIDLVSSFLTIILLIPLVQQTFKTKRISVYNGIRGAVSVSNSTGSG